MKIYYAQNSRAVRVAWLLEELNLKYEIKKFGLGSKEMRSPEYLEIHPMGRVPTLEDGSVKIFESGAIIQYILEKNIRAKLIIRISRTKPKRHAKL